MTGLVARWDLRSYTVSTFWVQIGYREADVDPTIISIIAVTIVIATWQRSIEHFQADLLQPRNGGILVSQAFHLVTHSSKKQPVPMPKGEGMVTCPHPSVQLVFATRKGCFSAADGFTLNEFRSRST